MSREFAAKLFQNIMDIWIKPEIKRRDASGRLSQTFDLQKAQIIFSIDRKLIKIRLNEEVKAIAEAAVNRKIAKGEVVTEQDVDDITKIRLTDDDPNCAHVTLLKFKNNWIISFDFKYNKKRVLQHVQAASEFYQVANLCLEKRLLRPFFENSYACAELVAKAILLIIPDKKILRGKGHEDRRLKFRGWANLGNVKIEYSTTLDKLTSLRPSARYLESTEYKKANCSEIINTLKEMIDFAQKLVES